MNTTQFGGAVALSLLLAACGEKQDSVLESRPGADAGPATSQANAVYSAAGEVTAIAGDQVTISHGPVEGIGWSAMTITFRRGSPEMVQAIGVGDRVSFGFRQDGRAYVLTSLSKDG